MLTYQLRERVFLDPDDSSQGPIFRFPADATVQFTLEPSGQFGVGELSGSMMLVGVYFSLAPGLSTGRYDHTFPQQMEPISDAFDGDGGVEGNILTVRRRVSSIGELSGFVSWVYFALPVFLNLEFPDAPVVSDVRGSVGPDRFVWAYAKYTPTLHATTQQLQEEHFAQSWRRSQSLKPQEHLRLFAALHYLHVARRLGSIGFSPWEFTSEALLNYAKVLQVVFPAMDGKTRDAVRQGLAKLDYSDVDIEKWYLPAMALRDELDSAHVSLDSLEPSDLRIVHNYTAQADEHFRELLRRVTDRVLDGTYRLRPYHPGDRHHDVIRRLSQHFKDD